MKSINNGTISIALFSGIALLSGCAASQPSKHLVQAQETYSQAENGYARQYAPDELLEAEQLLEKAKAAKDGSRTEKHYAYLADRQARLATSSGTVEYYAKSKDQAEDEYINQMEQQRTAAREKLEQRESELGAKEAALTEAERARREAEERAQAAIASLEELASVKEEANETVITLSGSVLFQTGESTLLPIAEQRLDKVASALKKMDDEKEIVVEGHTDSRGAREMNRDLSQRRAESVMNYLASEGVEKSRLKAVGKGESEPIAPNDSPEGRANNRRVELRIADTGQASAYRSSESTRSQGESSSAVAKK